MNLLLNVYDVLLPDDRCLVGLFVCVPLCLPSWCVAGREGGRHEQPGWRTQARRTSSDEVKGHNDQMIGTTEGKCVAM